MKLAWMREHEPELFARVALVLLPKDWLRLQLTGEAVSEMSDAAGTLWLDVAGRCWNHELLGACGLREGQMPALVEGSQVSGHLLPELKAPRVVRKGLYSPSAVVWHVGAKGELPAGTHHHNIHFANAWDESFDALIKQGRMMPDPSRLVTVPTISDPSLAPEGGHVLYVLEPAPNLDGVVDWTQQRGRSREELQRFLETEGYPTDIVTEELVDPLDWERQGMERGTPFALAHTFLQTGPFRPKNVEKRVPGLFFAGSGTTPGVGVPMVLVSGRLAAERVVDHLPGAVGARRRSGRRSRSEAVA